MANGQNARQRGDECVYHRQARFGTVSGVTGIKRHASKHVTALLDGRKWSYGRIVRACGVIMSGNTKDITLNRKSVMVLEDILDDMLSNGFTSVNNAGEFNVPANRAYVVDKARAQNGNTARNTDAMTDAEFEVKYSIRTDERGRKYVELDRHVFNGEREEEWENAARQYIDAHLRNHEDIVFVTEEGHRIMLTELSSWKMVDRHKQTIARHGRPLLSAEQYNRKLQIAEQVDEIIPIAMYNNTKEDLSNHGSFAKDGFNYYTVFVKDGADKYKVSFSTGVNEENETMYSIGAVLKVTRRESPLVSRSPSRDASVTGNTRALSTSDDSLIDRIPQTADSVNSSDEDLTYSERTGELSNREILANAYEGMVQNQTEYDFIQRYHSYR